MNTLQSAFLSKMDSSAVYRHGYLAEQAALYLLRGMAAALCLPFELLQSLRWGLRPNRKRCASWSLSLLLLLAIGGALWFSLGVPTQNSNSCGALVACLFIALSAGIGSGRLQMYIKPFGFEAHPGQHGGLDRGGRGRHHAHRGVGVHASGRGEGRCAWTVEVAAAQTSTQPQLPVQPQSTAQASGVCIHNCKICNEPVCVRQASSRRSR
jgi:hypothetical protein